MTKCLSQITPHSIQLGGGWQGGGKKGGLYCCMPCLVSTSLNGFVGITGTVCNADSGLGPHCLVRRQTRGRPGVTTIMSASGDINTSTIIIGSVSSAESVIYLWMLRFYHDFDISINIQAGRAGQQDTRRCFCHYPHHAARGKAQVTSRMIARCLTWSSLL